MDYITHCTFTCHTPFSTYSFSRVDTSREQCEAYMRFALTSSAEFRVSFSCENVASVITLPDSDHASVLVTLNDRRDGRAFTSITPSTLAAHLEAFFDGYCYIADLSDIGAGEITYAWSDPVDLSNSPIPPDYLSCQQTLIPAFATLRSVTEDLASSIEEKIGG